MDSLSNLPVKQLCVIGLGYIGLPTAAIFAARGVRVLGVDVNESIVRTINEGGIHISEPELDIIVQVVVSKGMLRATNTPEPADAFLIAVPTPFKDGHEPDLSHVRAAVDAIAPVLAKGNIVILESTSPVGTTEQINDWLRAARPDLSFPDSDVEAPDVLIAYCPERVLPGHVVRELVENARVIGGITPACSKRALAVYRIFVEGECVITDSRTAEMCKLTENASRDVSIAFANEISMICDQLGINTWELIRLANLHPRVNILDPGPGVGGHCIAVDPWFIVSRSPERAKLIHAARSVNDSKPDWVIGKVEDAVAACVKDGASEKDLKVACFGIAFKADIGDLRESPALKIAATLAGKYPGRILVVEPNVEELPKPLADAGIVLLPAHEAVKAAQILVLLVDHKPFRALRGALPPGKTLIDTKGIWGWERRRGFK
jgi:UDP-N-acetyl-D-mannosaminuronic acid dehydrogenase